MVIIKTCGITHIYWIHKNSDGPIANNSAELFRQIDTDGDDKISVDEAAIWYARITNRTEKDVLDDPQFYFYFDAADSNHDGFIQPDELDSGLHMAMGDWNNQWMERIIEKSELEHDGHNKTKFVA